MASSQQIGAVGAKLRLVALQVRDPLSIGTPRRASAVAAGVRCQLARLSIVLRFDDVDVRVVVAICILCAIAEKKDKKEQEESIHELKQYIATHA